MRRSSTPIGATPVYIKTASTTSVMALTNIAMASTGDVFTRVSGMPHHLIGVFREPAHGRREHETAVGAAQRRLRRAFRTRQIGRASRRERADAAKAAE